MKTSMLLAAASVLLAGPVFADVAGQKLDSGLGQLPHYKQWVDKSGRSPLRAPLVGESIDSGLGELPHYSLWTDPTGRDPMGPGLRIAKR